MKIITNLWSCPVGGCAMVRFHLYSVKKKINLTLQMEAAFLYHEIFLHTMWLVRQRHVAALWCTWNRNSCLPKWPAESACHSQTLSPNLSGPTTWWPSHPPKSPKSHWVYWPYLTKSWSIHLHQLPETRPHLNGGSVAATARRKAGKPHQNRTPRPRSTTWVTNRRSISWPKKCLQVPSGL